MKKYESLFEKTKEINYLTEKENLRENKRHLGEMSNLSKKTSELPVNLWLDDDGTWMTTKHKDMRLKFQGDKGNYINRYNMLPMSISDEPEVLVKNPKNLELSEKEINLIKKWVILNLDLLIKLSNQEIVFADFIKKMKKVK